VAGLDSQRQEDASVGREDDLVLDRAVIVAVVEAGEIERFHRLGLPEAQRIARVDAIPQDRRVIGHALDDRGGDPPGTIPSLIVGPALRVPAERHVIGDLRPGRLPGIAEAQPLVGDLHLPAIADHLIEDAEFIANAVADGRDLERCQRVHVAGGQAAKPTIAQGRV
jgi:hypothetical protein